MTSSLGLLPEWDLSDLYKNLNDPALLADIKHIEQQATAFEKTYQGVFIKEGWTERTLEEAIQFYETLHEGIGKAFTFVSLLHSKDLENKDVQQAYQNIQERLLPVHQKLLFFTLELNQIPDEKFAEIVKHISHYAPWLLKVRKYKTHQLPAELERVFLDKSLTSRSAWVRLYDETLARVRFPFEGDSLGLEEMVNKMSDPSDIVRKDAAFAFSKELEFTLPTLTLAMNTILKDKAIDDNWHHFPTPMAERHLDNEVDETVVEALVTTVKKNYKNLAHRYYHLKAKLLNKEYIEYWDRNAPLPFHPNTNIPWEEAKEIILSAYSAFHPKMAEICEKFFNGAWIDAVTNPGKMSGAFSCSVTPSTHPYILLNYQGKMRDVMTLAHELGHGIHQYLARKQGYLLCDTPLTLAETASVFGEMLTFQSLLKKGGDDKEKCVLLASKIEDQLNTVVRQIAFHEFESRIHALRQTRELSSDDFGDIWITTQREALGEAVHLDEKIRPFWSYITHFVHTPFYVYAYAFGDCLVNSLYASYQISPDGFSDKYITLLSLGGSQAYTELLKPFHLDPHSHGFWENGLSVIKGFIDQLEKLMPH